MKEQDTIDEEEREPMIRTECGERESIGGESCGLSEVRFGESEKEYARGLTMRVCCVRFSLQQEFIVSTKRTVLCSLWFSSENIGTVFLFFFY